MKIAGKREANKLERRRTIVEIARRSFLEHGYADTSMSAIAGELGGSKSTLWCYFPSKEGLFEAVLGEASSAFREELVPLLVPDGQFGATVAAFCRSFIALIVSPDGMALHRLVIAESPRFPEVGQIFSTRCRDTVQGMLTDFFAVQMDKGHMRRGDPIRAARDLVSLCAGIQQERMYAGGATVDIDVEAAHISEMFLRAHPPG